MNPGNQESEPTAAASELPAPEDAARHDGPQAAESLETVQAERDELRERWLRAEAELDNYRKRVRREAEEASRYRALPLVADLVPALDNLDLTIAAAAETGNVEQLLQGVQMVASQFGEVLARHGAKPIESVGKPFDPNVHEALRQVASAEHPPMTVVQEFQRGYRLHDRVVRPSRVAVSSGPPEPET
ncbi:MAG: nucleotide exchange factor GrpE [Planctomycetes bacterium]|nr:nucleotide exchange factor GrpE [Planctomycetota bacterium]